MSTAPAQQKRILLLISYDGLNFSGFAPQANTRTVTDVLVAALRDIDPDVGPLTGTSRTDAGVHALGHPVAFSSRMDLHGRGWVLALAQRLPKDLTIVSASFVPLDFEPRRDPLWKRYHYRIFASQVKDPFLRRVSWRIGESLDLSLMAAEAKSLEGEHDMRAFRSVDDRRNETVRRMDEITVRKSPQDPRQLDIYVQGNRFMYNMVRIIAGTLVDVGRGRQEPGAFKRAIASGKRRDLGMTAPSKGLTLIHVELRTRGTEEWPQVPAAEKTS